MASVAQERSFGKTIVSTVAATATHALIPVFWLFCSLFIMPRYYAMMDFDIEDLRDTMPALFTFSQFLGSHSLVYLFLVALMLAADGAVHYSLLRASKAMAARLWSLGIVIVEIAISLLLYLPLRHTVANMAG
ncbi:MAG: hypothetical protein ACYSWW_06525 [Planctomycetota bacterium]|jgi:hypothetical protein